MARNQPQPADEGAILREIATKKIEAERVRVQQLAQENEKLRTIAADLQKKISVANAKVSELERKLKLGLNDAQKEFDQEIKGERESLSAEIKDLKERHQIEIQKERDRWEKRVADLEARHVKDVERLQQRGEREIQKVQGTAETIEQRLADMQESLDNERKARQEAEQRLRNLDQTAKRIGVRTGQVTGFEVDTPEELLDVLGELDAEAPLKVMRAAVRELRGAASNVERAFARAIKGDEGRKELHDAGSQFNDARALPPTEDLPPSAAMLVEEAFNLIGEEVGERIKGRHYSALISAMANELVRVLRNQREGMDKLQRLVEIAEGTELATSARLLLKGATGHQQEIAAAKLLQDELKQVQAEAREQKGKVKKLYASAESGMAGEWALNALQAIASLQPLPAPDREAIRRPLYNRVVESAKLVQERIDAAINLGAGAEAALREADEAFAGMEGVVANMNELVVTARRQLMSKVEGEQEARAKLESARRKVSELGKRGARAMAIFDEAFKAAEMLLNQWKATYKAYSGLARDVDRIEGSIEGAMLDINQPLESEQGRKLYGIIHDLSEHLPEYRSLQILRQRMFFHLENAKQRLPELKAVRETSHRIMRAVGEPDHHDHARQYQLTMARLYDTWAYLEEVRGGTHSQLAVAAEQIEPLIGETLLWLSSTNIDQVSDYERDEAMYTASYVRKLKRHVLGIHDLARQSRGSGTELTAQFEHRLDTMQFPPEWQHILQRLKKPGGPQDADISPTEHEPR
ncbi:MAG: hypothetical protein IT464_10790 [Planctomycetes bacterium]|nr:hypothetical protein [Planctomycetota bacterium]